MVKIPLPSNASTKRYHKTLAQNASTNGERRVPRSGKMQCSYTISKGSQTARITLMSVSLCHKNPDAGGVAPIGGSVWCLRFVPYLLLTSSMRHPIK